MGEGVAHHHYVPLPQRGSQKVAHAGFEGLCRVVDPSRATEGPILPKLMLAESGVLVPVYWHVEERPLSKGRVATAGHAMVQEGRKARVTGGLVWSPAGSILASSIRI
jgi:hypothetical protein